MCGEAGVGADGAGSRGGFKAWPESISRIFLLKSATSGEIINNLYLYSLHIFNHLFRVPSNC